MSTLLPTHDDLDELFPGLATSAAVFISGSAAEGWAHATSDVDLYAVTSDVGAFSASSFKHDIFVDPPLVPIVIAFRDRRRIDLEVWTEEQIRQIIDRCADGHGRRPRQDLSAGELDLLYRVAIGLPVRGEAKLNELKDAVRAAGFQRAVVKRALYSADTYLEDAAGALSCGDLRTAVLAAQYGWERAVDALLARDGELAPSFKWRARKMQRAQPAELSLTDYWDQQSMAHVVNGDEESWVADTILKARRLILEASVDGAE